MFKLEKPVAVKPPMDTTDAFESALRSKGIRVERVDPVYQIQTIHGTECKEITSNRVPDIDYIISELVRINPYVVFLREVKKVYTAGESYYSVRFNFIAPVDGE